MHKFIRRVPRITGQKGGETAILVKMLFSLRVLP
jgi:hypothetical protein